MFCNRCGNKLSPESQFCNRCGNRVAGAEESTQPQQSRSETPFRSVRPARRHMAPANRPAPRRVGGYQEEEEEPNLPETYYDDDSSSDNEEVIFQIRPAFYNVGIAYIIAISISVALTAGLAFIQVPFAIALAVCSIFFLYPLRLHIQNRRVTYTLTSIKVEIEEGIFSHSTRNIPLRNIQDVTVQASFQERLIGIGDVLIDSASTAGKITMTNINDPNKYADMILDQLEYWR